jgi:DtxR family Mn-dependent transcriptional regulator
MVKMSDTLQDYLEGILYLAEKEGKVRITDLAAHLGIAKPSATSAVKILGSLGYINQERYGPIELTSAGWDLARQIRHSHNVLRQFLTSVLGVCPEVADREACQMEHTISSETLQRLVSFLEGNNPLLPKNKN